MSASMSRVQEIYLTNERVDTVRRHCMQNPAAPLAQALRAQGDAALSEGPFSVMHKTLTPPSGDKHDFLRMPTYAWPNPDTPDGLPYIIRDGEPGPAISGPDYDMGRMMQMTEAVISLSWASLMDDGNGYADHAEHLLRVWFIDPETRMNPNLTYSKYTPGDTPPYPTGVIATHRWVELIQAVGILAGSPSWNPELLQALQDWFRHYLAWLDTSDQGTAERGFPNNRGTWYDAQTVAFAMFVGDRALARAVLRDRCPERLEHQIAPDGSLPAELRRTNSLGYTLMTLKGWSFLALMGAQIGIDLWEWRGADGRSLRGAFDYVAPYVQAPAQWPHQQISPVPIRNAIFPFCAATSAYGDNSFRTSLSHADSELFHAHPASVLFS